MIIIINLGDNKMEAKKKNTGTVAGLTFVGFMFIGISLGLLFNMVAIGCLLGMGVGFLGMGVVYAILKQ